MWSSVALRAASTTQQSRKASKAQLHEPRREGGREGSRETGQQGKKDKERDRKKDIDKERQALSNTPKYLENNSRKLKE